MATLQRDLGYQFSIPITRRRQKHSCDQCRQGKRACDAGHFTKFPREACTGCQRKKKHCTFEWLKSLTTGTPPDRKRLREIKFSLAKNVRHSQSSIQSQNQQIQRGSQDFEEYSAPWVETSNFPADENLRLDLGSYHISDLDSLDKDDQVDGEFEPLDHSTFMGTEFPFRVPESTREKRAESIGSRRRYSDIESLSSHWRLADTTSRHLITCGLLRIYHDSMENALSCWLTEHNCPYTMIAQRRFQITPEPGYIASEWASMWSNRIYYRIYHLEEAYKSIRSRPLTRKEERMTSQALNMAILAFASQWTRAGKKTTNCPPPTFSGNMEEPFPRSDEFEYTMQQALWHQASQVLHATAGIESFQVVFALIIFSMTQRPIDRKQPLLSEFTSRPGFQGLQQIIEDDQAPLLLELGIRQILSHRRKIDCLEREQSSSLDGHKRGSLKKEDRETFNLLYWLCVMFDTISAAMCNRPLVIEDQDSNLLPIKPDKSLYVFQETCTPLGEQRDFNHLTDVNPRYEIWGDRFISKVIPNSEPIHWPCSYQLAALTLSSAAPVKVLLFRRVSHLQTLLSRRVPAVEVESAIKDTLHVYDYWARIYNPFMLDCSAHHDELPPRIQSWYIPIVTHWHLATFLLSDLLSLIDNARLSLPTERLARQTSNLVQKLQRENAIAVADLIRSSLHGSPHRTFENASEFHFALNKAALLTEPWTVVLIRSLSRAGQILAEIAIGDSKIGEQLQARSRCGDCIEALWFLERKSDMAFLAARLLSDILYNNSPSSSGLNYPENDFGPLYSTSFNDNDDGDLLNTSPLDSVPNDDEVSPFYDAFPDLDMESWSTFTDGTYPDCGSMESRGIPETISTGMEGIFENVSLRPGWL